MERIAQPGRPAQREVALDEPEPQDVVGEGDDVELLERDGRQRLAKRLVLGAPGGFGPAAPAPSRPRPQVPWPRGALGVHGEHRLQGLSERVTVDRDPGVHAHVERLAQGAGGRLRTGGVDDVRQRRVAGARHAAGDPPRHDDRGERRLRGVDMQPDDAGAGFAPSAEHEEGDVLGRRGAQLDGGRRADDAMPRPRRREQDDDRERQRDAEQEGGPRVEPPHHCAPRAHVTGLNEVASPIMRSSES